MFRFKEEHSLEARKAAYQSICSVYADRFPVIVERFPGSTRAPTLPKKKFLVPADIQMGRFVVQIRSMMPDLHPTEALFFYVNSTMMPVSALMQDIYHKHCEEDGFLYIHYAVENTYG